MAMYNIVILYIGVICGYFYYAEAEPQKTLRVSSVQSQPYLFQTQDGQWSGFLPDVLEQLGYNFTISEPSDKKYGMLVNGSWTGMMKDVLNGDADIAGPLTLTYNRSMFVEFSVPVASIGPVIVMKRPVAGKPSFEENLAKLLTPFEFSVWLMSVLALLVTGTVLYIIAHFNPYEWRRMAKDREATVREAESFTCMNSFWFVVSTVTWQGYVRSPRSIGARILVLSWFVFTIIFISCYIASLTNYLRIGPEPFAIQGYSKIRSFRDLAEHSEIRIGVLQGGATEAHFRNTKSDVEQKIYNKIMKEREDYRDANISNDVPGLVSYLRNRPFSDYAIIIESDVAKFYVHQDPCDLYMISEGAVTKHLAMIMQKGSPLVNQINSDILKMQEAGELNFLANKWFQSRCTETVYANKDDTFEIPKFYSVTLGTFSSAFLILVAGIILGGFATVLEVCIYKWAENNRDEEGEEGIPINKGAYRDADLDSSDKMISPDSKPGGATQV